MQANEERGCSYTNLSLMTQNDTSIKGLGACLLQDQKPVYFSSQALTEVQRRYVAIELESLAVMWAIKNSTIFFMQATLF